MCLAAAFSCAPSGVRDGASSDYSSSAPGTRWFLPVQFFSVPGIKLSRQPASYPPGAAAPSRLSSTRQRASARLQKQPAATGPRSSIRPAAAALAPGQTSAVPPLRASKHAQANRILAKLLPRGQARTRAALHPHLPSAGTVTPPAPNHGCPAPLRLLPTTQHLDLSVASVQQPDGKQDALLEDLLILGVHDEVSHQFGGPFSVQPALDSSDSGPVLVLACGRAYGGMQCCARAGERARLHHCQGRLGPIPSPPQTLHSHGGGGTVTSDRPDPITELGI